MAPGLIIRKKQMDAVRIIASSAFKEDMVNFVQKHFPNHYRIGGESNVREMIDLGMGKARSYGLTTQHNVALYITVMFMLGSYFDEDFLFPQLQAILKGRENPHPRDRAQHLANQALAFQKQIAGPQNRSMNRAFLMLRKEHELLVAEPNSDDFNVYMKNRLKHVFPNKYDALGEPVMVRFVLKGIDTAETYGYTKRSGQSLFITLMFFLGTNFDRDPFLSWVHDIFQEQTMVDEDQKISRLHQSSAAYLDQWLEKL